MINNMRGSVMAFWTHIYVAHLGHEAKDSSIYPESVTEGKSDTIYNIQSSRHTRHIVFFKPSPRSRP